MNELRKHFKAKVLRKNLTDTERVLWKHLRAKQIEGCKFRRQEPIGSYIVDFVCHEKRIIIEVDGGQHTVERKRDKLIQGEEYKVLRFWNNEVLTNTEGVLKMIMDCLNHPPLTPPIKGGAVRKEFPIKAGEIMDAP
jgi:very-short-patch-repair endonuclease